MNNYLKIAEEKFFKMTDFLKKNESKNFVLSELEEYLHKEGRELLKFLLQGHIEERGVGDIGPSVIGIDRIKRSHKRIGTRKLKTLFGIIQIRRIGYSNRNTTSLFPLDGMLNLPILDVSYSLQKHLVLEVIKNSFDESIDTIKRWTGVKVSKDKVKKVIIDAANDFEAFYSPKNINIGETLNDQHLVILTSDGKGVVMRYEDLREETKIRCERNRRNKINEGFSKKIKANSKRMATVASVYEIDRFIRRPEDIRKEFFANSNPKRKINRPMPQRKRVWAGLEKNSEEIIEEMFIEALKRDPFKKKEWIVLVDGDINQIKKFKKISKKFKVKLTIVCDIIHVLEYIWKAGKVLYDEDRLNQWVSKKLDQILEGKSSIVASSIRRSATNKRLSKSIRQPIDACAKYLLNHSCYLNYNQYLKNGYPIATGIIEGTCRYLIKDRMEITGARWSLKGADALLKLRAIKVSGDFELYWKFHESKQYERNYERLYLTPSILKK